MRHVATFLVLVLFAWVSSGVPAYLHAQEHVRTERTAAGGSFYPGESARLLPDAGELLGNEPCVGCLVLHSPQVAGNAGPVLVAQGEWVPFVTMLAVSQQSQTFLGRFSCRGPPVGC